MQRLTILTLLLVASGAGAQTLTEPDAQTKAAPPAAHAKALPAGPLKSCSLYGPGFYYVPATGTCLKIGGSLNVEGTQGAGR